MGEVSMLVGKERRRMMGRKEVRDGHGVEL